MIARGAEAILIHSDNMLIKKRVKKGYRHPQLDIILRKNRTRRESRLLDKASNIISVPKILKIDEDKTEISMQFIPGKKLSEYLDRLTLQKSLQICRQIGREIASLHKLDIIHGDLTTSNMIFWKNKVWFIDFGLGFVSSRLEDKAVDIHLLRQALESRHFLRWKEYFEKALNGYREYEKADLVLKQLKAVEMRGRYKKKAS